MESSASFTDTRYQRMIEVYSQIAVLEAGMYRSRPLALAILVGSLLPSAAAQDTVCFGLNCEAVNGSLPGVFDVYNQLGQLNAYNARQTLDYLGLGDDETRKQCIQRCQQDFSEWLNACSASYPPADSNEDVAVAQGRLNCAAEGDRRQRECLAPANFSQCP